MTSPKTFFGALLTVALACAVAQPATASAAAWGPATAATSAESTKTGAVAGAPGPAPDADAPDDVADGQDPLPSPFTYPFLDAVCSQAADVLVDGAHRLDEAWFDSYVRGRIVTVTYPRREPLSFGPWQARADFGATDASDDGEVTEWATGYYITHDWSQYGQQILSLVPGDWVEVNGRRFEIQDVFNYPKDGYYGEIAQIVGDGAVVLQTCYPDSDLNRIAYGW